MTLGHHTRARMAFHVRRSRRLRCASIALASLLAAAAVADAQLLPRFDFELSHPGARSLGFGGAFAALADDATAAYANPAGLVQLTRSEVSLEARHWRRSPSFLAGVRPTGIVVGRNESSETAPSFASLVFPRGRWTLALYSHRVAAFEIDSTSSGAFELEDRRLDTRDRIDLRLDSMGAAAALRLHERLSVGLALVRTDIGLRGRGEVFFERPPGASPSEPPPLFATSDLAIDGADVTVSSGVLWSVTDRLSAAAFFRQGAKVGGRVDFTLRPTPSSEPFPGSRPASFAAPDVLGVGGAYRTVGGRVTVAAEVDHVGYDGLVRVDTEVGREDFSREYRNSWEYRLGAEYAVLSRRPVLGVRAGIWVEAPSNDLAREDITHLALGIGIAGEHLQLDVAADLSQVVDTGALSLIYTF